MLHAHSAIDVNLHVCVSNVVHLAVLAITVILPRLIMGDDELTKFLLIMLDLVRMCGHSGFFVNVEDTNAKWLFNEVE